MESPPLGMDYQAAVKWLLKSELDGCAEILYACIDMKWGGDNSDEMQNMVDQIVRDNASRIKKAIESTFCINVNV